MLVLREGAGVGGARLYCSGKDANAATNAGGVVPRHTHSEARGCSSAGERRGESCPLGPLPQGCPGGGKAEWPKGVKGHRSPLLSASGERSVRVWLQSVMLRVDLNGAKRGDLSFSVFICLGAGSQHEGPLAAGGGIWLLTRAWTWTPCFGS